MVLLWPIVRSSESLWSHLSDAKALSVASCVSENLMHTTMRTKYDGDQKSSNVKLFQNFAESLPVSIPGLYISLFNSHGGIYQRRQDESF
jgi:hypothetical protein